MDDAKVETDGKDDYQQKCGRMKGENLGAFLAATLIAIPWDSRNML